MAGIKKINDHKIQKSSSANLLSNENKTWQNGNNDISNLSGEMTVSREAILSMEMRNREMEYMTIQDYRVFCGTWNVNGQQSTDLKNWLSPSNKSFIRPHIYAIGFQELDLSKNVYIFNESVREDEWIQMIERAIDTKEYTKIHQIRLIAMLLVVYVENNLKRHVSNVSSEKLGTGILGMMGNKGGVAIRMQVNNTKICFVNSHLAAHMEEIERRNQDFHDISARLIFRVDKDVFSISDHDCIFWFGDLNYRIYGLDIDRCKLKIEKNQFKDLLKYDQLTMLKQKGCAFKGYIEGEITFRPTYKYDVNSDSYDSSEKNRTPAWCDRILWKGENVSQIFYRSHHDFLISDHKPVSSLFTIGVKLSDTLKERQVRDTVMKILDQIENDTLPQVQVEKTEITFKDIIFCEAQEQLLTITNTGQAAVQIKFLDYNNEINSRTSCLLIRPHTAVINIGDKLTVSFEIMINETVLRSNADIMKKFKYTDIFILHLENGKDFFITVSGNYKPSCFGSSLRQLAEIPFPIGTSEGLEALQRSLLNENEFKYYHPKELWLLIHYLNEFALKDENIFRIDGLTSEIKQIRNFLDTSIDFLPSSFGTHSVASTLIVFLNLLFDPVIPYTYYDSCLNATSFEAAKMIINNFPVEHKKVLWYIIKFLKKLLHYSNDNKLDERFLCDLFGNILLRSSSEFIGSDNEEMLIKSKKINFVSMLIKHSNIKIEK